MGQEFAVVRRVAFCETDMAGVMHFSNYLRWMEDVEHAFWRSLGISVHIRDGVCDVSWPRVNVSCEYLAPLRFEDEVRLALRLVRIGGKSIEFAVEFHRGGQLAARGRTTAVCCSLAGGVFQPVAIPETIRGKLATAAGGEVNRPKV
jgi:YbgC/YbaW family acyl-CoA thioester hydrolase